MKKRGKRYLEVAKLVDKHEVYDVEKATELAISTSNTKFDATVELQAARSRLPSATRC